MKINIFRNFFSKLLADSEPTAPVKRKNAKLQPTLQPSTAPARSLDSYWEDCENLARSPQILDRFIEDLNRSGLVGEDRVAKLVYLVLTTRWFSRPVSLAIKGPSSGGKSYTVEQTLRFFPAEAYYELTAMSERAIAYSTEPLKHRFLVIYEAAGVDSKVASYLIRSLLSEGRLRYETVEKTSEGLQAKRIEREGPTGLLTTTTSVGLHPENETRLLSVTVNDSREQTMAVMAAMAEERTLQVDLQPWQALQKWLEGGEHRVLVPFASALACAIQPAAVRLRRDFNTLITLIKAHAILHQASRKRTEDGMIIAVLDDYEVIRELVGDLISQAVKASVPITVRETVGAVARLQQESQNGVSVTDLAKALKLDKSAASRRVRAAQSDHYLVNLEEHKGKPARLEVGEPLPEDVQILPAVEKISEVLPC